MVVTGMAEKKGALNKNLQRVSNIVFGIRGTKGKLGAILNLPLYAEYKWSLYTKKKSSLYTEHIVVLINIKNRFLYTCNNGPII